MKNSFLPRELEEEKEEEEEEEEDDDLLLEGELVLL
jgi:hypothetical protein